MSLITYVLQNCRQDSWHPNGPQMTETLPGNSSRHPRHSSLLSVQCGDSWNYRHVLMNNCVDVTIQAVTLPLTILYHHNMGGFTSVSHISSQHMPNLYLSLVGRISKTTELDSPTIPVKLRGLWGIGADKWQLVGNSESRIWDFGGKKCNQEKSKDKLS